MALEITGLLIAKLNKLYEFRVIDDKLETEFVHCKKLLKDLKESLKGAEDDKANGQIVDEWNKLLPLIYSLEDFIESTFRSETVLQTRLLRNRIRELRRKLGAFKYFSEQRHLPIRSVSSSDEIGFDEDMQQFPTKDDSECEEVTTPDLPTGNVSGNLNEYDRHGPSPTSSDPLDSEPEDFQASVPLSRQTNSAHVQLRQTQSLAKRLKVFSFKRLQLSRKCSIGSHTDHQSNASDGAENNVLQEKSLTVVSKDEQRWEKLCDIRDKASDMVGLEDKVKELAAVALGNSNATFVISVLGATGSGKTTLVRSFYNSIATKQHFECRAWISVPLPQDVNEEDILLDLFRQLRKAMVKQIRLSVGQVREEIQNLFVSKRCLIVLDDVRFFEMWKTLNLDIQNPSSSSKVILTTRSTSLPHQISTLTNTVSVIQQRLLSDDETWQLFKKAAKIHEEAKYPRLLNLKEKILRRCRGLPLRIILLGGLLSTKTSYQETYDEWLAEIEQTNPSLSWQDDDVVKYYYRLLPIRLKWCLLYLGLFPDKHDISIRRLLLLWIAEGLVMPQYLRTPLEVAMSYFQELVTLGMIQITDGSRKTCSVTTAVGEKLFPCAQKAGFFHFHRSSTSGQKQDDHFIVRRLAESDQMFIHTTNPHDDCLRHLRSYISFYREKGDGVNNLLKKIVDRGVGSGMLVTLDLEGVYKPVLDADTLGKLRFLRYLGLRWTFIDSIPETVGDLPFLETLDIKHTCIINLPSTIWNAKKLERLYMSEICVDSSLENASSLLDNLHNCVPIKKPSTSESSNELHTLWGLMIKAIIPERKWFDRMKKLRRLKLTCREASIEFIAGWIEKLHYLESLKLRSTNESHEPGRLEPFWRMRLKMLLRLKQLYLVGELPKAMELREQLPRGLKILTLSVSRLQEDPMEILGKLPKLKVLRLYANSFMGENMTCHRYGFPKLQILKLWMLPELQNWTVEENAMKKLRQVEIRCCRKLKEVQGLEKLTNLTELTLTNMGDEFVEYSKQRFGRIVTQQTLKLDSQW